MEIPCQAGRVVLKKDNPHEHRHMSMFVHQTAGRRIDRYLAKVSLFPMTLELIVLTLRWFHGCCRALMTRGID